MGKSCTNTLKKKISSNHSPAPELLEERNFESLKLHLKKCAEFEKTLNKNCLKFHLEQGKLLEEFHGLWIEERAKGSVSLNWKDWLKENNIGFRDRNVRKRKSVEMIEPFPCLKHIYTLPVKSLGPPLKFT